MSSNQEDNSVSSPAKLTPPPKQAPSTHAGCLYLSDDVIRFEAVSEVTAVFFDESNAQLIISRSNGAGGIVVKSKKDKNLFNLRLQNLGDISSLNFSPDSHILAIKRTSSKSIHFANVYPGCETKEFTHTTKLKNGKIIGMCWVSADEVALVSDKGVEYYQIFPEKKALKLLKSITLDVQWYLWMADGGLCMLATGSQANVFYGLQFKDNTFSKMAKMEIDLTSSLSSSSSSSSAGQQQQRLLKQKDFTLIKVYGNSYMTRMIVEKVNCLVEVHLCIVKKEAGRGASEVLLLLQCSGRVVLSVVDNLIILHHHQSKTSHIFDIGLDYYDKRGGVKFHLPIIPPLPIRPLKLKPSNEFNEVTRQLYSPHWAIFSPDVILNAKEGCYWNLKVDLEALMHLVEDKVHLISILMLRKNSQSLILKVCHDLIKEYGDTSLVDLDDLSRIFDKINRVLANQNSASKEAMLQEQQVVEQDDVQQQVFLQLHDNHAGEGRSLDMSITEYLLSLSNHNIPALRATCDLLMDRLLQQGRCHQLQQLLQYRLFPDSKPLAIRLLSLSAIFPAANQLSLDMLRRMSASLECVFELLLSNKQVVSAIRYAQSLGLSDQLKARKFLEVAMTSEDDATFYVVYHYFEDKNLKNRGGPNFVPGDQCDTYVAYYNNKFNNKS